MWFFLLIATTSTMAGFAWRRTRWMSESKWKSRERQQRTVLGSTITAAFASGTGHCKRGKWLAAAFRPWPMWWYSWWEICKSHGLSTGDDDADAAKSLLICTVRNVASRYIWIRTDTNHIYSIHCDSTISPGICDVLWPPFLCISTAQSNCYRHISCRNRAGRKAFPRRHLQREYLSTRLHSTRYSLAYSFFYELTKNFDSHCIQCLLFSELLALYPFDDYENCLNIDFAFTLNFRRNAGEFRPDGDR